jgi:hypothetical protein
VHGAELAYVLGRSTSPLANSIMSTWAGFAKDPANALDKLGWITYKPGGQVVRLGYQAQVSASMEPASGQKGVDELCNGLA